MVTRRRAGGVSAIASMAFITRFTSTCCKSTWSPLMMQGLRRQIDGGLDLPRPHVVSDERKAFMDHGVEVDRFRVQLMTSEHGPMAIDDLCGLDALGLDVGQDLAHRVGRRTIRR